MNIAEIKHYLSKTGTHAKRNFSQNFLFNDHILNKIVNLVPDGKGFYIEIGGGLGSLTSVAVERKLFPLIVTDLDNGMLNILKERFFHVAEIIRKDGAKINFNEYFNGVKGYVFGNLPYQVSSPILMNTCFNSRYLDGAVFLLQKEVAEKFCAQPCSRDFGPIAGLIKLVGHAEYIFTLPPEEFFPAPKVYSAVLKITFKDCKYLKNELEKFADFMRLLFSNRRKTLYNSFKINNLDLKVLDNNNVVETKRAEELEWDTIINIFEDLIMRKK